MLSNSVQLDMLPKEVAIVEGRELVQQKKSRNGSGEAADEVYFQNMLNKELNAGRRCSNQGDGGNDGNGGNGEDQVQQGDRDDSSSYTPGSSREEAGLNDHSSRNDSSGIDSSSGNGTSLISRGADGLGKDGMEYLSDIRCCLILGLIASAATLAVGVYSIVRNDQVDDFYAEFESSSIHVYDSVNNRILDIFKELERVSVTTTSFMKQERYDEYESQENPEVVTIPDVEYILGSARDGAGADFLGYVPLITSQRDVEWWTEYSQERIGWLIEASDVYVSKEQQDAALRQESIVRPLGSDTSNGPENVTFEPVLPEKPGVNPDIWRFQAYDEDGTAIPYHSLACPMWTTSSKNGLMMDEEEAFKVAAAIEAGRVFSYYPEPFVTSLSPVWTSSPPNDPSRRSIINFNAQSDPTIHSTMEIVNKTRKSTFGDVCGPTTPWMYPATFPAERYAIVTTPVFDVTISYGSIIGHYVAVVPWVNFFNDITGDAQLPVTVAVSNDCGRGFTLRVQKGKEVVFLNQNSDGKVDREDFNEMKFEQPLAPFAFPPDTDSTRCESRFTIAIYPTETMEEAFQSNEPLVYSIVVLSLFVAVSLAFGIFDCIQQNRHRHLLNTARRQNLLVSALFPKNIQNKLLEEMKEEEAIKVKTKSLNESGTAGLKSYLERENQSKTIGEDASWGSVDHRPGKKAKPIADLFPETTIMFADIVGFTAWSSEREPAQVFILLENIYREFDRIAKGRRVFKVEVVGDCYVAVCGLPDPRKKHAVQMAKFAVDCLAAMAVTVKRLELELGPETSDLKLRVGLHSGPVVAGVLRGDRSRFQLFGDTMNTASRMESTGVPNRIQISQDTADALKAFGKENWFVPREAKVVAKGKGALSTYFLVIEKASETHTCASSVSGPSSTCSLGESRHSRASLGSSLGSEEKCICSIDWATEVLANILKAIVARRRARNIKPSAEKLLEHLEQASVAHDGDKIVIDEVSNYVALPAFDDADFGIDSSMIDLEEVVMVELREYVQCISKLYNNGNPFHNFDHANHVLLSVNKLLNRINTPDIKGGVEELYQHTFGITSSPLTWFSVVLSALIHDVDHSGVSNAQLLKEKSPLAYLYKNKSVAEQNSFDIGWDLLMEDSYKNLRRTIYATTGEFKRFRQLTINSVIATDVFDKELKHDREVRWDRAFEAKCFDPEMMDEIDIQKSMYLKASIVIEHLIQASDVAHTMQHWHIYRKWNTRLFMEMHKAFTDGRMEKDPTEFWYQGEIGFFDHYVIPLAQKLKSCGVFGVSSAEYLNYAEQNRAEWEKRGEQIVSELSKKAKGKFRRGHNGSASHAPNPQDFSGTSSVS